MARGARKSQLENKTARMALDVRKKPYHFTIVAPGVALGYRRCYGPGRWVVRASDLKGGVWTRAFALADDLQDANGETVLDWKQAQPKAREHAGKGDDIVQSGVRPATVDEALDTYEDDLASRGKDAQNATRVRYHVSIHAPGLLTRPVALLIKKELREVRVAMSKAKVPAGTIVRTLKGLVAALNLAAEDDPRIVNGRAWKGLATLEDSYNVRDAVLSDKEVDSLIDGSWKFDDAFGLMVETLAVTGTRFSQAARLVVNDLQDNRPDPHLMMPVSKKGKGKKKRSHHRVPITLDLAAKLRAAAGNRPASAPLLLNAQGAAWDPKSVKHREDFVSIAKGVGIEGQTMYALRHSSIVRALLGMVPPSVVAANHDTSEAMISKTYAKFISDHSDAIARRALLDRGAKNVVALPVAA